MSQPMETGTPCTTPRREEVKQETALSLDDEEVKQRILRMTVGAKAEGGKVVVQEWPQDMCDRSKLLSNCFDDPHLQTVHIELEYVPPYTMDLAFEYFQYHKKVAPREIITPITSSELKDIVDEWDCKFIAKVQAISPDAIFDLQMTANYLGANDLLMLCVVAVATMMRNKSAEQICKAFNIRADYTPAEEEEVRKTHGHLLE